MQPDFISLIAGLGLMAIGLALLWSHRRVWRTQQQEFIDDPRELRHLQARFRRRTQTSGLIALVGVLIPVADLPVVWQQGPLLATLLWGAIGLICVWIGVLAVGDLMTTKAHSTATLARLEAHKDKLMEQLERLRPEARTDDKSS